MYNNIRMILAYYNLVDSSWILPVFQAQWAEELEVYMWNRTHTALEEGNVFEDHFSRGAPQKNSLHKKLPSADLTQPDHQGGDLGFSTQPWFRHIWKAVVSFGLLSTRDVGLWPIYKDI